MGKYYVYRHVRVDKKEVFYIGIGTKYRKNYKCLTSEYNRAYAKYRSSAWKRIVNKTEYAIEIIFESNCRNEILNKEIEFIKIYGRRDLNKGTLVNHTDGGSGIKGYWFKSDELLKVSKSSKRFIRGKHSQAKPIWVYDLSGKFVGNFDCCINAAEYLNIGVSNISRHLRKLNKQSFGYRFFTVDKGKQIKSLDSFGAGSNLKKRVVYYDNDGKVVKSFSSATEAAKSLNKSKYSFGELVRVNSRLKIKRNVWCYDDIP